MNVYTYRGYQYDKDTGFYYLQSRYYDPEVGRFLNADDTNYLGASGTTLGYNLYAYCENNSINNIDSNGKVTLGFKLKCSVVAGIAYGLYKTTSLIGIKLNVSGLCKVGYKFVEGFVAGFGTVWSLFSINLGTLLDVVCGIIEVFMEYTLGNVRNAADLLETFIDGYSSSYLSRIHGERFPIVAKISHMKGVFDTFKYFCKLLAIKV